MSKRARDDAPIGTITVTATIARSDEPRAFEYTYGELDDTNASALVAAWSETYETFEEFMERRECANVSARPTLDECARGAVTTYSNAVSWCARDDILDMFEHTVRRSRSREGRVHIATLSFVDVAPDRVSMYCSENWWSTEKFTFNAPFATLGDWTLALQLAMRSTRIEAEDDFAVNKRVNIYYTFE